MSPLALATGFVDYHVVNDAKFDMTFLETLAIVNTNLLKTESLFGFERVRNTSSSSTRNTRGLPSILFVRVISPILERRGGGIPAMVARSTFVGDLNATHPLPSCTLKSSKLPEVNRLAFRQPMLAAGS